MTKISTKELIKTIEGLKLKDTQKKLLIITNNDIVFKSSQNLKKIATKKVASLSVESIINADVIVISSEDIKYLEGGAK